jgi:hypothetical protein
VLDLNDKVEALTKGGDKSSPLFQEFLKQLVGVFGEAEKKIKADQGALPQDANGNVEAPALSDFLDKPMSEYLDMTASQELQDFIQHHDTTSNVVAQHPNIKESK